MLNLLPLNRDDLKNKSYNIDEICKKLKKNDSKKILIRLKYLMKFVKLILQKIPDLLFKI